MEHEHEAPTGAMMSEPVSNRVLNLVREGMRVVDVDGEEVGKVADLKMGDPEAATVGADQPEPGVFIPLLGHGEPDVPEPLHSQLLRVGYVKVDGKGWIDKDRYLTANVIGRVAGDTVYLTVDKDRLMREE
jgi:hypothetical protein